MKALVIGATGSIGNVVATTLESRGHDVVRASRRGETSVDVTDPASIAALFAQVTDVDAVVVAVGSVPFKPLAELTRDDYLAGFPARRSRRSTSCARPSRTSTTADRSR